MVKIYSTPTCVYCKMAKEFFNKYHIPYIDVDVTKDDRLVEEMVQKSHQMGVPVIDIDGEIFVGFDRSGIAAKLGIK
ncbi:glutaredoxin family protein [Patescibacteria group bacterium]|nr:glutaredoxin family protein [Patescibacteria group bacterium]